ncbi:uncharacterized protein PHACADRAFT_255430 [Phanerochaete carnosa HHB-10118-sp]|uniref:Uncharacterized protein n=1 Tax=Phanerochaete carnosa (strain HHB-10118-sp) TaxID=650164 RepID=K5W7C7_PHACS|nr:uncharacterized protein PHACADRAFT_255430 [Phanerochaete carnosa HHB-10118-sp]EKM55075.1 hypothetical protein PHACADRAFT_255430 [Phanerochaete carnosa HHB-10118-sp]
MDISFQQCNPSPALVLRVKVSVALMLAIFLAKPAVYPLGDAVSRQNLSLAVISSFLLLAL